MADGVINKAVTVRVGIDVAPSTQGLSRLRQGAQQTRQTVRREFAGMGRDMDLLATPITRVQTRYQRLAQTVTTTLSRANDVVTQHHTEVSQLGSAYTRAGAVAAAGLALVGGAAIKWESDFAGVRKTINDTETGYQQLDGQLRNLAKTLPATHTEIAGVAEAAGQLGVARKDLVAFTKTAIDLGESTNLSADQAATGLAQLMSVLGESYDRVSNVGSALVRLGNNGASTEAQILELGQRFSGAARQAKLSAAETLAYGSAITSVGINVEAGGTAISKVFQKIDLQVRNGGRGLEALAATSGKSTGQFAKDFRGNAADAVSEFVTGLGRITAKGGSVRDVLADIGVKGAYETDVLLRLAGATKEAGNSQDILANSLEDGRKGYSENIALLQEAEKRYGTTASQAKIAFNVIRDQAITVGQDVLPVVQQLAAGAAGVAEAFGDLPGPVKSAGLDLLAAVAILGLLGGGALKVVGSIGAAKAAVVGLGLSARTTGLLLRTTALAVPVLGVALFAVTEIMGRYAKKEADAAQRAATFEQAISTMTGTINRNTAALNGNVRAAAAKTLLDQGAFRAADLLGVSYATVTSAALGQKDALDVVNKAILENGNLNAQASKENSDRRNAAELLSKAIGETSRAEQQAIRDATALNDATTGQTAVSQELAAVQADLTQADQELTAAQKELKSKTDAVARSFTVLNQGYLDAQTAADNLAGAQLSLGESIKENGSSLESNTRKGLANRQAIRDNVLAINEKITADFKNGLTQDNASKKIDTASKSLRQQRKDLIDAATKAGFNRAEVKKMVDQMLLTPKELKTKVDAPGVKTATTNVKTLDQKIRDLRDKQVEINASIKLEQDKAMEKAVATFRQGERDSYAKGGRVRGYDGGGAVQDFTGAGRTTYDTQPAMLRVDEHVWTPEEVDAAGGHAAMYRMRQAALDGNLRAVIAGYARGGTVSRSIELDVHAPPAPALSPYINAATAQAKAQASAYAERVIGEYVKQINKSMSQGLTAAQVANANGLTSYRGGTFSNLFAANIKRAEGIAGQPIVIYQGGFRPATTYSGTSHQGDALDTAVNLSVLRALRNVNIATGDRTGLGNWIPHMHGVPLPGAGYPAGSAIGQGQDYLRRGGKNQSARSPWGLARGGVVHKRPGGVHTIIGEGNHDELVTPLPHGWNGYANGGKVTLASAMVGGMLGSYAAGGKVGGVDLAALLRLIVAQTTAPLRQLAKLTEAVAAAQRRVDQVNRAGRAPQARVDRANRAVERGKDKIADQADRVRRLAKAAAKTKGETKADRDEDRARKRLAELRAEQTKLNREKEKAAKANARYDAAEQKAAEKLKDAKAALKDQQQQLADQARSASEGFQNMYRSASTDARDWLDSLKQGAGDLTQFRAKIDELRKKGLSEDLIQRIIGQGASAGTETANSILGNQAIIKQLNDANGQLVGAANLLGYTQVTQSGVPKNLAGVVPKIAPFGTPGGLAAAQAAITPIVYVQNPFTGKYLLAGMVKVADGQIASASKLHAYAYAPEV